MKKRIQRNGRPSKRPANRLADSGVSARRARQDQEKELEEGYRRELEERRRREAQAAAFVQNEMRRLNEENMRLKVLLITNGIRPE